jgi:hypothetical protein
MWGGDGLGGAGWRGWVMWAGGFADLVVARSESHFIRAFKNCWKIHRAERRGGAMLGVWALLS